MGDAIVKPSRFRKEAINIAGMDRSLFLIVDSSFLDSLLTLLLLLLSELLSAVAESLDVWHNRDVIIEYCRVEDVGEVICCSCLLLETNNASEEILLVLLRDR